MAAPAQAPAGLERENRLNPVAAPRVALSALAAACARHRLPVILLFLCLAAASLAATVAWLGVTTDTGELFDASLPWKRRSADLARLFPQNDKLIVAVVDAAVPEVADATAASLADALEQDKTHFTSTRRPDALPYFQQNAFLFIGQEDLQTLLDRMIDVQPLLGELVVDPSLRGLFSALSLVVKGAQHGHSIAAFGASLDSFHAALAAAAAGHATPLSWQRLLGGELADQAGRFRFVLMKPLLDYGALQPGGTATAVARQAAAALPYVRSGEARVRFTGQVVLDDEELATVAHGALAGLAGSFALVTLWLYLALRSWRVIVPVVSTLVLGLVLTTGVAAVAIGTLNLISVAFAVLFVGLAVDFAIQFAVRFREQHLATPDLIGALRQTGRHAGGQVFVAALATAAGFLAFAPTQFVGLAQLGIIAGLGMLVALACTVTFLPAMLSLCRPAPEAEVLGLPGGQSLDHFVKHRRKVLVLAFVTLAAVGAWRAPRIGFDGDPLHTKDQGTESVSTLRDLAADPFTSPYNIQALMPSLASAQDAARAYAAFPQTQLVLTLNSFVPAQQDGKLAALQDAAALLGPTLALPARLPKVTPASLRLSAQALAAALATLSEQSEPGDALRAIGQDAHVLAQAPDATLLAANEALTAFFPMQLARLREALSARAVSLTDVPLDLRDEWLLADGRARVQALPRPGALQGGAGAEWAAAALMALPNSSGSAVYILKSTQIVTDAFRSAMVGAIGAIAVILAVALRRVTDVLLVMTSLLISSLLTALLLSLAGVSLNFANIIALPLLLGVGVSFNIYFAMNWRAGATIFLSTPTARAIVFSALTTSTAFGSLALSGHPGTASMGALLLVSLACTVLTTLFLLPALLAQLKPAVE